MTHSLSISGSLRNRLVLTLTGGAAVLALVLFFAIRNYTTQIAQQGQDSILNAAVTSILDAASIRDNIIEVDIPYASFSMLSTQSDDLVFYAIYQDDTFLSGYPELPLTNVTGRASIFQTALYRGETVRLVTAGRVLIGTQKRTQIRVVLAQSQGELADTLRQISRTAALFGAAFFALLVALSYWATSTTIGQLKRLTTSVTRRGPQDLRPFVKPVPTEMAPLVTSLNSLMGRLDHSLSQSEDFIAEAAHRVRTPLATVRSYAEVTLQRVDKEENRQSLRAMIRAIDESSRAAGQLLDHAMITLRSDHLERQDIDLVTLVHEIVLRLTPIAEMKDLELCLHGDSNVAYSGDPVLIQNAVRNLIDNAIKYAPSEGRVDIAISASPRIGISVCDSGHGFPSAEVDTLAVRFKRGTNADGTVGSGLGLTIAIDVAKAHGGDLVLSNRPEGGACALLLL
ncbi:two-component system sensor histidine kinase TctE [Sulfitobacter undariae]|uniref:histidine kinase n=1 Tax=Sulfitobacter undariae TaxID=1563671 RepID=A0A7W6E6F5_9RHOB|nr:sensor histidine kinase [Sulfitobacter undariae]MBB3995616.1 two-component system sensor histidine kinase TctE [Sulfitobacter undariae]